MKKDLSLKTVKQAQQVKKLSDMKSKDKFRAIKTLKK